MEYTLTLTDQEVSYFLTLLKKQPLENSYSLFNKVGEQLKQQKPDEDKSKG